MFSFYSDDSYEPIQPNPDLAKRSEKKPPVIPSLNLDNLPEYESSSDEEEANQNDQHNAVANYEQSMKYIENFYNKQAKADDEKKLYEDDEGEDYIMC